MLIVEQGTVIDDRIELDKPLAMPSGSKVIVQIQPADITTPPSNGAKLKEFAEAFPFIGQWTDRTDIPDSAEYVRQMRAQWHQRPYRQS